MFFLGSFQSIQFRPISAFDGARNHVFIKIKYKKKKNSNETKTIHSFPSLAFDSFHIKKKKKNHRSLATPAQQTVVLVAIFASLTSTKWALMHSTHSQWHKTIDTEHHLLHRRTTPIHRESSEFDAFVHGVGAITIIAHHHVSSYSASCCRLHSLPQTKGSNLNPKHQSVFRRYPTSL